MIKYFYFLSFLMSLTLVSCIGMKSIRETPINDYNLARIDDGDYTGTFKKSRWNYTVIVTVVSNEIDNIEVLDCANKNSKNTRNINNNLVNEVIENQSVKIDVVSGASITTKSFQIAVDRALSKGEQ